MKRDPATLRGAEALLIEDRWLRSRGSLAHRLRSANPPGVVTAPCIASGVVRVQSELVAKGPGVLSGPREY
jgi:hypothetical protein